MTTKTAHHNPHQTHQTKDKNKWQEEKQLA
jgi:hypothetical protein